MQRFHHAPRSAGTLCKLHGFRRASEIRLVPLDQIVHGSNRPSPIGSTHMRSMAEACPSQRWQRPNCEASWSRQAPQRVFGRSRVGWHLNPGPSSAVSPLAPEQRFQRWSGPWGDGADRFPRVSWPSGRLTLLAADPVCQAGELPQPCRTPQVERGDPCSRRRSRVGERAISACGAISLQVGRKPSRFTAARGSCCQRSRAAVVRRGSREHHDAAPPAPRARALAPARAGQPAAGRQLQPPPGQRGLPPAHMRNLWRVTQQIGEGPAATNRRAGRRDAPLGGACGAGRR